MGEGLYASGNVQRLFLPSHLPCIAHNWNLLAEGFNASNTWITSSTICESKEDFNRGGQMKAEANIISRLRSLVAIVLSIPLTATGGRLGRLGRWDLLTASREEK